MSRPPWPCTSAPGARHPQHLRHRDGAAEQSAADVLPGWPATAAPNGHYLSPTLAVAAEQELVCPECGEHFFAPGAEELAFNSQGACRTCGGEGPSAPWTAPPWCPTNP